MGVIIGRDSAGNAVSFIADSHPIEADAIASAEAAIGSASVNAATSAAGAVTLNNAVSGTITTESLSTAIGGIYSITLTSNLIKPSSVVLANVTLGSATQGTMSIVHITPALGSVNIKIKNVDAANALNGTLKIGFAIFQ